jgi:regulator of protease activity HflC (stomatin/prohibitin superfamily)
MKPLIKNIPRREKRRDFLLNTVGIGLALLGIFAVLVVLFFSGGMAAFNLLQLGILLCIPALVIVLMVFFPRWAAAIKLCILVLCVFALIPWSVMVHVGLAVIFAFIATFVAPAVQRCEEWERAIILRFGRFYKVQGPGLFLLVPIIDRIAQTVDMRIRVTDFSAQETLTLDSVTVTVDALCFWLVWDPEKAILEVQNYEEAVILSSKTALRHAVSSHTLTTFLERGDIIARQLQTDVDKKTTEWGITIQYIEITDIQIPETLQDSLARLAQAEREKKGRILLAEAEIEIAHNLESAALVYAKNGDALKLKTLSILNEGLKAGNSMMLVPNDITEELKSGAVFGLDALAELQQKKKE